MWGMTLHMGVPLLHQVARRGCMLSALAMTQRDLGLPAFLRDKVLCSGMCKLTT